MPRFRFVTVVILILAHAAVASMTARAQDEKDSEVSVSQCWVFPAENVSAVASHGNDIYIGGDGGRVTALSTTGEKIWQTDLGGEAVAAMAAGGDSLLVITTSGKTRQRALARLSRVTGVPAWTSSIDSAEVAELIPDRDSILFVSGTVVRLYDGNSPQPKWQVDLSAPAMNVYFGDEQLLLVTRGGELMTIAAKTGKTEPARKVSDDVTSLAELASELLVGDAHGNVTAWLGTAEEWRFKTGAGITGIVPLVDDVLVMSRDNFIYRVRGSNGGLVWKKRLAGRISSYVLIGRYLVASTLDQHGATVVDLESGRVAGQLRLGTDDNVNILSVVDTGDLIILPTSSGVSGYSTGRCGTEQRRSGSKP
ncbi:MAG: PQQ-binding-like beta-propeller repeat protein [Pyrinomonadaceae bacterium]